MSEQTKMVMGFFGKEKPITRDDFIKIWRNTARDLTSIADSVEDYEAIMDFVSRIKIMAAKKWDALP